jgi:hypothetical protein
MLTCPATAVFSSTIIARLVRNEFRKRSSKPGPYRDITTGFSHDPCERPMNLITQIPNPGQPGNQTVRGRSDSYKGATNGHTYNPNAPKFVPGHNGRGRKATDADGWQTVQRKK